MVSRSIEGTGDIDAANLAGGYNLGAAVTGSGDITDAALGLIAGMVASLSGSGSVTASMIGALFASAGITGTGTVAGDLGAIAGMLAAVSGSGAISAGITAKGSLSSDISVSGDLLTTTNVGEAVWAAAIEAGYTAEDILRLISAVLLGESSGFASSPTFTGLDGSTPRVAASLDSNGNRSSVTLDPE
jgi:hypothetical protein